MKKRPVNNSRWRKIPADEYFKAEAYLGEREKFCVAASARFLKLTAEKKRGHVWYLNSAEAGISSLLLHSRASLFPVFGDTLRVPAPRFLNRFLGKVHIHSLQGLKKDAELLETLMEDQGYFASEKIDYELMGLDAAPGSEALRSGPPGLVLRQPLPGEEERLFALQAAYEQEEVLPKNADFNPALCRFNLRHILSDEYILAAYLDNQIVGKINTSAASFTRFQIGGVYVRPDCRGLGIGARMTAEFSQSLLALGRGVTLFVKKRNRAAAALYRKVGFTGLGDYRISYF